eukprot:CAMPEP_0197003386 /NCGR_PEP_ID=MMETSP1380-20130617/7672_1 /TAXON_ID=5936 /ORGANISM="Euplotes crassus, Strain CT5" /LENGTH=357 /DNA_ID=CAMNT_0042421883 /DNA_START=18 /DNA_END=1091 /DNA_ORIENTATION=-
MTDKVTAISFNKDGSQVAICTGEKEILIYETKGSKKFADWEQIHILKEHTQKAAVIDWNHETGLILTGSYDRSIFVWKYSDEHAKYLPQMVNMDEKLAILDAKWNRQGTKFVVGTSSKRIYVGTYSAKHGWWATEEIKKEHKSSVLAVEFSPNGRVIASVSFDGTCKILSAYMKDVDEEETKTPFGDVTTFGECLANLSVNFGLIMSLGLHQEIVFVMLLMMELSTSEMCPQERKVKSSNILTKDYLSSKGRFIGDDKFLAVGYDKAPFLFKKSADKWSLDKVLDKGFDKFKDFSAKVGSKDFFALREVESDIKIDDKFKMKERDTKHENTIQYLVPYGSGELCTCDDNGNIFFWKV